jgi:hypothetical protein
LQRERIDEESKPNIQGELEDIWKGDIDNEEDAADD